MVGRPAGGVVVFRDCLVVPDHLADDEVQELLRKRRVQLSIFGQPAQAGDLGCFAPGVPGREAVGGLEEAHLLRGLEPLRQEIDQGCIDVVDARPDRQQLRHHRGIHLPGQRAGGGIVGVSVRQIMVQLGHGSSLWAPPESLPVLRMLAENVSVRTYRRGRMHMKIAVLGTGVVGRTLAGKLVESGHDVVLGSRSATNEAAVAWATEAGPRARAATFFDAAAESELVINATPGSVSLDVLAAASTRNLAGKVLLDVANPLDHSAGFPPSLSILN